MTTPTEQIEAALAYFTPRPDNDAAIMYTASKARAQAETLRTAIASLRDENKELLRNLEMAVNAHQACKDTLEAENTRLKSEVERKDESGWLAEWRTKTETFWWGRSNDPESAGFGWTKDSNAAMRFAREQDAEMYIEDTGWTDVEATDHSWPALAPLPEPPEVFGMKVVADKVCPPDKAFVKDAVTGEVKCVITGIASEPPARKGE